MTFYQVKTSFPKKNKMPDDSFASVLMVLISTNRNAENMDIKSLLYLRVKLENVFFLKIAFTSKRQQIPKIFLDGLPIPQA